MSAQLAPSSAAATLGRFQLRRVLGRGAQAVVWLGYDPKLEREVAVKLMRTGDEATTTQWMQEARSVSRLAHPNIVPVFEADMHDGKPYLVFEYVPGRTLSQHLKARGPLPPHEAVGLMLGVLDALQAAHDAGVIHRDLKPSNVLVDGSGRGRVMDFGIAARVQDGAGRREVVGTPGYMSPEAANGEAPSVAMDVFAAGLVLIELLHGTPLVADRDAYRAIYRVAHEDLALPADLPSSVDDPLRGILMRAIARDGSRRHPNAAAMRSALQGWLTPAPMAGGDSAPAAIGNSGTLDFLLRRMRHKSDFPALSDSVVGIQRVASSESDSVGALSNEILKDVALTNKLLRLVNTARYAHAGGGSISTVSRAVALIGFAGVRNMAMSLMLLEHMHDKAHANVLKDQFLRAMMAGSLASELSSVSRESEEAFIGAMFQNLGRLLTDYYFPEEAREIRGLVEAASREKRGSLGAAEQSASTSVLGVSFQDLGLGVAKTWGLPDSLQRCMHRPSGDAPSRPPEKASERLRWLALASNDVTDVMMRGDITDMAAAITAVALRYAPVLGLSVRDIESAANAARQKLAQTVHGMGLNVTPGSAGGRLLQSAPADAKVPNDDSLRGHALEAMPQPVLDADEAAAAKGHASEVMAAGIQDITNSMVENFKLNEVLRMILETMFRALKCQRIVFCLRDPKTETLTGRFGLGEGCESVSVLFKVPLKGTPDLFGAVCLKGADTLISDSTAGTIAARLPPWYRKAVNAPAFLLLPLMLKGAPFALIYADKATPGGIELDEKELSMLRTLRNQAVMAFKQAG